MVGQGLAIVGQNGSQYWMHPDPLAHIANPSKSGERLCAVLQSGVSCANKPLNVHIYVMTGRRTQEFTNIGNSRS